MYIVNMILLFYYSFKSMQQFGLGVTRLRDIIHEKLRQEEEDQGDMHVVAKSGVKVDVIF